MSHGKTRRCPYSIGLVAVTFPITVEPAGAPVGMRVTDPAPGLLLYLVSIFRVGEDSGMVVVGTIPVRSKMTSTGFVV